MTNTNHGITLVTKPDGTVFSAPVWLWNEAREAAAQLIAEGKCEREAAVQLGLQTATIKEWLRRPEFQSRVDEKVQEFAIRVRQFGIPQGKRHSGRLA